MDHYDVLEVVGEGTYGVVYKCRDTRTDRIVAVKQFKNFKTNAYIRCTMLRELRVEQLLKGEPNVTQLLETFKQQNRLYLVMEYIPRNMLDVLEQYRDGVPAEELVVLLYTLLLGIQSCHRNGIIHRDVKPENILVREDGTASLCDFGFCRPVPQQQPPSPTSDTAQEENGGVGGSTSSRARSVDGASSTTAANSAFLNELVLADHRGIMTDYVATRWYRSPEMLLGMPSYSYAVDLWAVGAIMAEAVDGEPLLPGKTELEQLSLIQERVGKFPSTYAAAVRRRDGGMLHLCSSNPLAPRDNNHHSKDSADAENDDYLAIRFRGRLDEAGMQLLRRLLAIEEVRRITVEEALMHPYFDEVRTQPRFMTTTPVPTSPTSVNLPSNEDEESEDEEEQEEEEEVVALKIDSAAAHQREATMTSFATTDELPLLSPLGLIGMTPLLSTSTGGDAEDVFLHAYENNQSAALPSRWRELPPPPRLRQTSASAALTFTDTTTATTNMTTPANSSGAQSPMSCISSSPVLHSAAHDGRTAASTAETLSPPPRLVAVTDESGIGVPRHAVSEGRVATLLFKPRRQRSATNAALALRPPRYEEEAGGGGGPASSALMRSPTVALKTPTAGHARSEGLAAQWNRNHCHCHTPSPLNSSDPFIGSRSDSSVAEERQVTTRTPMTDLVPTTSTDTATPNPSRRHSDDGGGDTTHLVESCCEPRGAGKHSSSTSLRELAPRRTNSYAAAGTRALPLSTSISITKTSNNTRSINPASKPVKRAARPVVNRSSASLSTLYGTAPMTSTAATRSTTGPPALSTSARAQARHRTPSNGNRNQPAQQPPKTGSSNRSPLRRRGAARRTPPPGSPYDAPLGVAETRKGNDAARFASPKLPRVVKPLRTRARITLLKEIESLGKPVEVPMTLEVLALKGTSPQQGGRGSRVKGTPRSTSTASKDATSTLSSTGVAEEDMEDLVADLAPLTLTPPKVSERCGAFVVDDLDEDGIRSTNPSRSHSSSGHTSESHIPWLSITATALGPAVSAAAAVVEPHTCHPPRNEEPDTSPTVAATRAAPSLFFRSTRSTSSPQKLAALQLAQLTPPSFSNLPMENGQPSPVPSPTAQRRNTPTLLRAALRRTATPAGHVEEEGELVAVSTTGGVPAVPSPPFTIAVRDVSPAPPSFFQPHPFRRGGGPQIGSIHLPSTEDPLAVSAKAVPALHQRRLSGGEVGAEEVASGATGLPRNYRSFEKLLFTRSTNELVPVATTGDIEVEVLTDSPLLAPQASPRQPPSPPPHQHHAPTNHNTTTGAGRPFASVRSSASPLASTYSGPREASQTSTVCPWLSSESRGSSAPRQHARGTTTAPGAPARMSRHSSSRELRSPPVHAWSRERSTMDLEDGDLPGRSNTVSFPLRSSEEREASVQATASSKEQPLTLTPPQPVLRGTGPGTDPVSYAQRVQVGGGSRKKSRLVL